MKTALEYLQEAEEKLGTSNNASATARALKTTPQAIHNYKNGVSKMDDYHCIRVAQVLGIDPMEIIAAAQEEREKNEEKREFWRDFREARTRERGHASVQMIGAVAMMMMGALLAMKWPEGIYGLYYVKSCSCHL
ncbi:helix-turn-helix domain-containing protein [Chromobacterium violaceum]|uniref:helix-turn-helix domain-containing protein n=1 Tax=Chromobacterium violaceum TaxID=536 RepID=UPI001E4444E2|nr:helix-turn-helix domain-containing protein [Chromobacterium violaceum]MCD0494498.1 helix-turn-helix domain-containing protein [Chromobacterium violaceum]